MIPPLATRNLRRTVGALERAFLGTAMSLIVFVVERQISRRMRPDRTSPTSRGELASNGRGKT